MEVRIIKESEIFCITWQYFSKLIGRFWILIGQWRSHDEKHFRLIPKNSDVHRPKKSMPSTSTLQLIMIKKLHTGKNSLRFIEKSIAKNMAKEETGIVKAWGSINKRFFY